MINARVGIPGVYAPDSDPAAVEPAELSKLREEAERSASGTCRILLHREPSERLHEMVIVHRRGHYIPPHINSSSAKSYTILDGEMIVAWFDSSGEIAGTRGLGTSSLVSARILRFNAPVFHTVFPVTPTVTFVETILGPHTLTTYADWAPSADSPDATRYYESVRQQVMTHRR